MREKEKRREKRKSRGEEGRLKRKCGFVKNYMSEGVNFFIADIIT